MHGETIMKLDKRIMEQEEMIQTITKYVSDLSDLVGGDPGTSGVTARDVLGNTIVSLIILSLAFHCHCCIILPKAIFISLTNK